MEKIERFHKTTKGYAVFWIVELVLAYIFASLAIDHGVIFWYLLTLVFLAGFLRNFFKFIDSYFHGKD